MLEEEKQELTGLASQCKSSFLTIKLPQATIERLEELTKGYTKQARASMGSTGLFNALCFGLTERDDFSLFRCGSV